jgi:hypothetical protein
VQWCEFLSLAASFPGAKQAIENQWCHEEMRGAVNLVTNMKVRNASLNTKTDVI